MTYKVCKDCNKRKPLSMFQDHAGYGKDNKEVRCRPCHNAWKRQKANVAKAETAPDYDPRGYQKWLTKRKLTKSSEAEQFEAFFNEFAHEGDGLPRHAKEWVKAAFKHPLLLVNVPPRHAKTTIMSEWFPIWLITRDRNVQVIVVGKTSDGSVKKIARKIADTLEYNPQLFTTFGRYRPLSADRKWSRNVGELEVEGRDLELRSGDLTLQVRGSGQHILGLEADWLILDDVTTDVVAKSEVKRRDEADYVFGSALTRLSPQGRAFCIGQRVHELDLYGVLERMRDEDGTLVWHTEKNPAIIDEEAQTVLWPEVWPYKELVRTRKRIGRIYFSCMYQQTPEVAGAFVERDWIFGGGPSEHPGSLDRDRVLGQGWKQDPDDYSFVPITRVIAADPSPTQFAGIVVGDVVWQHRGTEFNFCIIDVARPFGNSQRAFLETIEDMTVRYHPQTLVIESSASFNVESFRDDVLWNRLQLLYPQGVIAHKTNVNKRDALMGVWSLATDFEAGRIRLPYGDQDSRDASSHLIREALSYPNGATDDVLMALWFVKFNYKSLLPKEFLPTTFASPVPGTGGRSWNLGRMRNQTWRLENA